MTPTERERDDNSCFRTEQAADKEQLSAFVLRENVTKSTPEIARGCVQHVCG